jgi:hypothetical protein
MMSKNILVTFDMRIGDYEHSDVALFEEKLSHYGYCKSFWSLEEKQVVDDETYWDNAMENSIEVHSVQEITNEQAKTLQELGLA